MSPFLAELLGTMLLILMGGGVVANVCLSKTKGNGAGWIAITTAWALGVFIGVVVAGPYSGAHLNPAVSIGLAIGGTFPWCDVCTYIAGQMIGAALGALLVWLVYKDHFNATDDPDAELGVFCTSPAIKDYPINFLGEMIGSSDSFFNASYERVFGPKHASKQKNPKIISPPKIKLQMISNSSIIIDL